MFFYPSITLIDNEEEELDRLSQSFVSAGIPCLPVIYDEKDGLKNRTLPPSYGSRIIFLDLNLSSSANQEPKVMVAPIAETLGSLKIEGPYLLVFWSKHTDKVDEVMKLLVERFPEVQLPVSHSSIEKHNYISNPKALKTKIRELIVYDPFFNAIRGIEDLFVSSALSVSTELYQLAHRNSGGKTPVEVMKELLTVVSHEAAGAKNAGVDALKSLVDGLSPLVADHLLRKSADCDLEGTLTKALPGLVGDTPTLEDKMTAKLNSNFHIDIGEQKNIWGQGMFRKIKEQYLKDTGKFRDIKKTLFSGIINYNKSLHGMSREDSVEKFIADSTIGLIEISPDCDHAQQHISVHHFVAGVLVPDGISDLKMTKGTRPHIYEFPVLWYNDTKYSLILNFRFQIGLTKSCRYLENSVLFRIREQIWREVSIQAAQYASRPGIIKFES